MNVLLRYCVALASLFFAFVATQSPRLEAQTLQVTYGQNGVQTLAYNGVTLEDLSANSADAFHIWHMAATDLQGNALTSGQYGWGEANNGRSWNAANQTWTYNYVWGSIQTQFQQSGNSLNVTVTTSNNAGSGIIFQGASIYPLALHFPQLPANFSAASNNQYSDNVSGPDVTVADYGSGEVISAATSAAATLYAGFEPTSGTGVAYAALISGASPDSLASYLPHYNRPLNPGQTDTFTVSLRFAPSGTDPGTVAADAYQSWAATYPMQLNWPDRRIIGTAFVASSPSGGNINQPGGFPTNPRRYFNDSSVDITTSAGLAAFQARILAQAEGTVANLTLLGAQGAITWDIEGEQYPQDTSYVCSPDQIATVAPEMLSLVTDPTSRYHGLPLIDAYFKTQSDAGFRTGVCIRPQVFTLYADGTAAQVPLPDGQLNQIAQNLITKMQYAHNRWGTTLFYVDSTVNSQGGTLPASIFEQVQAALPDSLVIPEETTPRHYAYTGAFKSFIFHTDTGTDPATYNFYPKAFSVNLVNDVDPVKLAQYTPQLTQSVRNGDILMAHADYWQANNPAVVAIYAAAGVTAPPALTTPTITWSAPGQITYGTSLSAAQLNAAASVAGTFAYSPAAGTVLSVGSHLLAVIFTPANTTSYKSTSVTVSINVAQAASNVTWPTLALVTAGTSLSTAQLNATSTVPGSFVYTPAAGTILPSGTQTLSVTFTPNDLVDYTSQTVTQTLIIGQASPTITFNVATHHSRDLPFVVAATSTSAGALAYSVVSGPATIAGSLVTLTGSGTVTLIATQAATAQFSAASLTTSFSVASGTLWLGNKNASLSALNLMGDLVSVAAGFTGGGLGATSGPLGVALDSTGSVWIAGSTGVSHFDSNGTPLSGTAITAGGIHQPVSVAVDGLGQVWVANSNGTISALSNTGTALSPATGYTATTGTPGGIAIDVSGNVWMTDSTNNTVTEVLGAAAPIAPLAAALTAGSPATRP